MSRYVGRAAAIIGALVVSHATSAEACGCFAPPSVAEPVIQAGERILFAVDNGKVIAHIQIQYSGQAKDFGWLVPLPSVPVLKTGSDELFNALLRTTAPSYEYRLTFSNNCPQSQPSLGFGCGPSFAPVARNAGSGPPMEAVKPSPVVVRDSVGSYEYAVLKADDRTEMFKWLSDNRFFVPTGTQDAVGPYVRTGAYFLALKLKANAGVGDITPIVLEYPAELPMIPLILTSVGATPNMGVQVWLVGNGRAIPRNFHHVVPNEVRLDGSAPGGYERWLREAIAEAPNKHAFVTEYAGASSVMKDTIAPAARFGLESELASRSTPEAFIKHLRERGFVDASTSVFPPTVRQVVFTGVPYPPGFANEGISEVQFLENIDYYLGGFRTLRPELYGPNYAVTFDAPTLARAMFEKHVTPMRETEALFTRFPTLTRLVTILSPENMTKDPVFSFNATLPAVPNEHVGTSEMGCDRTTTVTTSQGIHYASDGRAATPSIDTPAALRIETLSQEGPPTVVTDNAMVIQDLLAPQKAAEAAPQPAPKTGCSVAIDPALFGLALVLRSWRRNR